MVRITPETIKLPHHERHRAGTPAAARTSRPSSVSTRRISASARSTSRWCMPSPHITTSEAWLARGTCIAEPQTRSICDVVLACLILCAPVCSIAGVISSPTVRTLTPVSASRLNGMTAVPVARSRTLSPSLDLYTLDESMDEIPVVKPPHESELSIHRLLVTWGKLRKGLDDTVTHSHLSLPVFSRR